MFADWRGCSRDADSHGRARMLTSRGLAGRARVFAVLTSCGFWRMGADLPEARVSPSVRDLQQTRYRRCHRDVGIPLSVAGAGGSTQTLSRLRCQAGEMGQHLFAVPNRAPCERAPWLLERQRSLGPCFAPGAHTVHPGLEALKTDGLGGANVIVLLACRHSRPPSTFEFCADTCQVSRSIRSNK